MHRQVSRMLMKQCEHSFCDGPTALWNQRYTPAILRQLSQVFSKIGVISHWLQADVTHAHRRLSSVAMHVALIKTRTGQECTEYNNEIVELY